MSSTPSNTNRSWFKQLFEMSPDPSWIIDGNRFVECNEAAVRALGYTNRAEFLNTHPSKLSPPSQPDGENSYAKAEHMMAIAKDQGLHRFEWLHTKADGTNLVAEVTLSAIELRGRQVLYCVWRDITDRKQSEAALRESELRFRLTFELAASGIANVALDGRFVRVNRSLCAILGYSEQELIGRTVKELSHPEDRDKTDVERARVQLGELKSMRFEKRYLRKDGATVWVDLTIALVRDTQGKPLYEIAVFDDISERTQAEQALRDSVEKLRVFADNVPAMTAAFDQNLRLLFVNKRYADFFGYGATDILGKHLREIVGERAYSDIKCHYVEVLQGHPVTFQRTRKRQNDEIRYLEIKLMPNIGEHGKVLGCFAVVIDITEHKLVEERIQRVAHYDSLTGLPNRILFNDRLTQAISHAKRDSRQFALLYLDLNKFKPVNDSLGHSAGDELLHAVAARIRCQMRESDTVARVGGDEFVVILLDAGGHDEVEIVARKIIATVETPFQLGAQKQNVDIGTSIGIALYPAHARDADALIKAADAAMYSAKQMPGSSFRFAGLKPITA